MSAWVDLLLKTRTGAEKGHTPKDYLLIELPMEHTDASPESREMARITDRRNPNLPNRRA